MIALLVITDGRREHIGDTLDAAATMLQPAGLITERWIYNDTGDADHAAWLRQLAGDSFTVFQHSAGRQGFGGAIRAAWAMLRAASGARYVYHLEDDFTHTRPVDLAAMCATLDNHPELVQLALRRQPWNDAERSAGGIVEQHPADYVDRYDLALDTHWLEHRRFFTTNPSLYRASLMLRCWPEGAGSEGRFGIDLLADHPELRFAFWGARDSGEWVRHEGHTRNGTGY